MSDRRTTTVTVLNRLGLHARPAMMLVDTASAFSCDVTLKRPDRPGETVNAKSVMHVMLLAATKGTPIEVTCEGDDAEGAIKAIEAVFANGFDEM